MPKAVNRFIRSASDSEAFDSNLIDQRHGNKSEAEVVADDFLEAAASAAGANVGLALSNGILGRPNSYNTGFVGYPVQGSL